jgi:hypothetical protein
MRRMSDPHPVNLSASGPPETVLPPDPPDAAAALASALALDPGAQRAALAEVTAQHPRCLAAWAALGGVARDDIEAYACFRVGYHRGLDHLRQSGWRGTGYVRWQHPSTRGFLRSLRGLRDAARAIGEADEAERCQQFLLQLDPSGVPDD